MENMNTYVMRWRELSIDGVRSICPHHDGEWVKFADIKELLQTSHNSEREEISTLIIEIYKNRPVDRVYSREELISYLQRAETSPVA
jgi:hypothetical protein